MLVSVGLGCIILLFSVCLGNISAVIIAISCLGSELLLGFLAPESVTVTEIHVSFGYK